MCAGSGSNCATVCEVLAKDLREEIVRIQVTVKDLYGREATKPVPITIYRPAGEGPFPLVVMNHGRSPGEKRAHQGRFQPEILARYLVAKGFVVMAPTRIGYWETYGDFDPENSACKNIEPMSIAASQQVLATVEFAKTLPYVDASRWLVAGQSVGGLTAVATVGRAPVGLLGGINFSGGTGGNPDLNPGSPCNPTAIARYWGEIARNAKVPMLWMYWENDKYWGVSNPKAWHRAWVDGGGQAQLVAFGPSGENGHYGVNEDMDHWLPWWTDFCGIWDLTSRRLPPRHRPAALPISQTKAGYPPVLRARPHTPSFSTWPLPGLLRSAPGVAMVSPEATTRSGAHWATVSDMATRASFMQSTPMWSGRRDGFDLGWRYVYSF